MKSEFGVRIVKDMSAVIRKRRIVLTGVLMDVNVKYIKYKD